MQEIDDVKFVHIKALLQKESELRCQIISGSMEPVIKVGDFITVKPINRLRRFDILVFRQNKTLICHYLWHENRSAGEHGRVFITRPLTGNKCDLPICENDLLGQVENFRIPFHMKFNVVLRTLLRRT